LRRCRSTGSYHDAGRFRRDRDKGGQAAQKHAAGREQETTVHHGLLHDFVRVPAGVAIAKGGSTDPVVSKPARPAVFGIEPVPMALSCLTAPSIRLHAQPNVDFPALPPKAAGNPKTDRTEQAP